MIEIMLAVGSQAEAVAMALIRWYFQWAGAMGRVISARWLSLPPKLPLWMAGPFLKYTVSPFFNHRSPSLVSWTLAVHERVNVG